MKVIYTYKEGTTPVFVTLQGRKFGTELSYFLFLIYLYYTIILIKSQ